MFNSTKEEIILSERFDKDYLKFIVYNESEYRRLLNAKRSRKNDTKYNPIDMAKKMYARAVGNHLKTSYKFAKGSTTGRRFAGVSMQGMQRELRHTIARKFYNDLDIINCHPVILEQLCAKYDIKFPELTDYNMDRLEYLKDNDLNKIDIISIINGGYYISVHRSSWTEETVAFFNRVKTVHDELCAKFADKFQKHLDDKEKKGIIKNLKGSFINKILTEHENSILMCLAGEIFKNGNVDGVLCFDGIMVPKTLKLEFKTLEAVVLEKLNFKIKLKVKPMDEGFTITEEMIKSVNHKSDVFDFSYFREKVKTIKTEDDMMKFKGEIVDWMNTIYCIIKDVKSYTLHVRDGDKCPYTGFIDKEYCSKFAASLEKVDFMNKTLIAKNLINDDGKIPSIKQMMIKPYDLWNTSPRRIEYEGIEFNPQRFYRNKKSTFDKPSIKYNKFHGLAIEKEEASKHQTLTEDHEFFNHIRRRWANDDEDVYNYILNWFAHCIQKPGIKMKTAMVLKSAERAGKGIIVQIIAEILGKTYFFQPSDVDEVLGNFNSSMEAILFLFLDEMVWGGDKDKAGALKKLVSEGSGSLKVKFLSNRTIKQLFNLLVASNEDWVVPAGMTSTRWFIIQLNDELALMEDIKKQKIINAIQGVDRFKLARFFHERDISKFNPTKLPHTDALREQKVLSLTKLEKWWFGHIHSGTLKFSEAIPKTELYDNYKEASKDKHMTMPTFYRYLYRLTDKLKNKRILTGISRKLTHSIIMPTLEHSRDKWRYIMADPDWPFPEDNCEEESDSDDEGLPIV
jgi:hypothetical protein